MTTNKEKKRVSVQRGDEMKTGKQIKERIEEYQKDLKCHSCGYTDEYLKGAIRTLRWVLS